MIVVHIYKNGNINVRQTVWLMWKAFY